jgi:hypothetical protein
MENSERNRLIENYGKAYALLTEALKEFPEEMWKWKPAPEKWSIHEIIIHISDSEANSYIRCRKLIAEPETLIGGYDQDKWAVETLYHRQETKTALELFKLLRQSSYELIRMLPENTWTHTAIHSESGPYTFENWLKIYDEHIPVHIRQMQRNLNDWNSRG